MKLHISSKMHKNVIFNEIIDLCIKSCSARTGLEPDTSDIQVQRSTLDRFRLYDKLRESRLNGERTNLIVSSLDVTTLPQTGRDVREQRRK